MIGIDKESTPVELTQYPHFLYKYRDFNNKFYRDIIENQYLWADIPQSYYDPADSIVHLRLLSELPEIKKWLFNHKGELVYFCIPPKGMAKSKKGQTLKAYKDAQRHFLDANGTYNAKRARKIMLIETKKLPKDMQHQIKKAYEHMGSAEFEKKMEDVICSVINKVSNTLRDNILICCLTERNDNYKMWEGYSDNYTGFVIEFDLRKSINNADVLSTIARMFPLKYYKRFPKISWLPFLQEEFYRVFYGENINIDQEKRKLYKQLFMKRIEYKGEEEWRIIAKSNRMPLPIVSALYMGYRIREEHEKELIELCYNQKLSLYKQQKNPATGELYFKQILKDGTPV